MERIYKRVTNWNAKRYEREYDKPLALELLREEYQEWLDAKTDVERLDALCDIVFVAMGILWKNDADELLQEANTAAYAYLSPLIDHLECEPGFFIATLLDDFEYDDMGAVTTTTQIIVCAMGQMVSMEMSFSQAIEAMLIVCGSNDSKSVDKIATKEKGFTDHKGKYYQPPEPKLKELLNRRMH